mgnify:CR=1 FL=1
MKRFSLSISSGLLLALAWPTYGLPLLLFFGFVPMLYNEYILRKFSTQRVGLKVFGYSYLSFFIWNLITTYWLWYADPFGASFAILANSLLMTIVFFTYHIVAKKTTANRALIFLITFWICFEKFHLHWDLSWPWLNLGHAFSNHTTWIQWYEYTGVFGGTLWVWIANAFLFRGFVNYFAFPDKSTLKKICVKFVILLIVPIGVSLWIYHSTSTEGEKIKVIALQPNVDPYTEKYNQNNINVAQELIDLSREKLSDSTQLIIAPETVFARLMRLNSVDNSRVKDKLNTLLITKDNLHLLFGASLIKIISNEKDINSTSNKYGEVWHNYYNSALFFNKNQKTQIYHKSKLVVGIENFPYQDILKPVLGDIMIDLGGTVAMKTTQKERAVFKAADSTFTIAPIICYESVYGEFTTAYIRKGADALAIITNDGWWDTSQGHKQHLSFAKLRAIETRRDIVRSANTGISAIINKRGEITSSIAYGKKGALAGTIVKNTQLTFYSKMGDYIARISFFIWICMLFIIFFRKPKKLN